MITTGMRLGHIEVLELCGRGGMGQVWRGHDLKLKRDVAIKVLPDAFASNPERLARFQREAEVLASLDHPNIARIHGLHDSDGVRAIVMEYVEGPTLAERISQGAIPLDEALPLARQIADAFEAAHEKGVVHRDWKPANGKIKPDGTAKVLDFGLAKALESGPADPIGSNSPTLSLVAAQQGVILGTAAYMSPEQARGSQVDRRADIWSFGVVLFEMLTGTQLFAAETISDTLAAVLRAEVDWNALPVDTPASIRTLLRRCLTKDRKQRLRDIGEARIVIEEYLANPAGATAPGVPSENDALSLAAPVRTRRQLAAWLIAATAVLAVGAVLGYGILTREQPAVTRFSVAQPDAAEFNDGVTGVISPDGRRLAFVARESSGKTLLWTRSLNSFAAQPLPGTDGASYPFWSPDSRFLGFFAESKLKKIEVSGGPPQTLCAAAVGRGGTWNRDGVILITPSGNVPIFRVSAEGGEPVAVTTLDQKNGDSGHRWPYFLPDGRHFLYRVNAGNENSGIFVGSLESSDRKRLTSANTNAVYAPPGYVLFQRENTLMGRAFNAGRLEFTGEAFPIAERVASAGAGTINLGSFSASGNGILTFRTGSGGTTTQMTWFDRSGKQLGTAGPPASYGMPTLSPDEKKVAVARDGDIWVLDLLRGAFTRFTFSPATDYNPVWSPDGAYIAFSSTREGPGNLYRKLSSGTGQDELLLKTPFGKAPFEWSLDGRFLTYLQQNPKTAEDLYVLSMTGDPKPVLFLQTEFAEYENRISPDGRWMAYSSTESGRQEVYVQAFPPSGGKWQVSTASGVQPIWRRDGKELFFLALDGTLMAADVRAAGSTFEAGVPHPLFKMRVPVLGARNSYSPTADGKRFLVNSFVEADSVSPIFVVANWTAELKK